MSLPETTEKSLMTRFIDTIILFCLRNKLIVFLLLMMTAFWGFYFAPFDWDVEGIERKPIAVDAIPDIGENQQIVFTKWSGRSPQDIQDQFTYPLTVAMLGIPEVKTVRSYSMMGFSTVYIIFKEEAEFYWSRSRVLEKINSLPEGTLPEGVKPVMGPDATALGQVFWYTLEGLDEDGNPTGNWDLHELRSIQDWYVRYGLMGAEGISEIASVGGFQREYQIDVNPDQMKIYNVTIEDVFRAVKMSNVDIGAGTIEINKVEYVIRGLGFIKSLADIEKTVVKERDNTPVFIKDIANVTLGPALRRGALDKNGAEAVGAVALVRYGENPLSAIKNLKDKIREISPGLPAKVIIDYAMISRQELSKFATKNDFSAFTGEALNQEAWLNWIKKIDKGKRPKWLTYSKINIVPFYDRTKLIHETLDTLNDALYQEILVTIIVIIIMLMHLRSSLIISITLPLAVLICFIAMKLFHVDANIVALSGIAIAIGTIVDMGVIITENILKHLEADEGKTDSLTVIFDACSEVSGAVITAILTTVVSFLPIFFMVGAEGKLFRPLAFTKTFALFASVIVALTIIPALAHVLFTFKLDSKRFKFLQTFKENKKYFLYLNYVIVAIIAGFLTSSWLPLGPSRHFILNYIVVITPIAVLLFFFMGFQKSYENLLNQILSNKLLFLSIPISMIVLAIGITQTLGKEFMPNLDEGSYLFMPTTMPHASIGEALDILQKQDRAFAAVHEIETAVGKIGRADTALDPAPVSMIETVINYHDEYLRNEDSELRRFKYSKSETDYFRSVSGEEARATDGQVYMVQGKFIRDEKNQLIEDSGGHAFRLWRPALDPELNPGRAAWAGIQTIDDIWNEIIKAGEVPGTTSASKLQPIATRIVMLQSGMRSAMGVKIKGPDLETIEKMGLEIEEHLKNVAGVKSEAVMADRIVGKPYLEININRDAIARYGIHIKKVQDLIEVAVGGKTISHTVEGRERYPIRVRYQRELRDNLEDLIKVYVSAGGGKQIPLGELATITYTRGPQVIKSEDTFLIAYVTFDKRDGFAETDVVESAEKYLKEKLGKLPDGVNISFDGNYKNQVRANNTLKIVLPMALFIIFIILYLQFRSVSTSFIVFTGIAVAWAGGFIMIFLYGQDWFMNVSIFGTNLRDLFQIHEINMSIAIWVGFLALFGIATDDGVVMATYLTQEFENKEFGSIEDIRTNTILAAKRRLRPCLLTTATTILSLLPVLTSNGRGADIMIPMAIPSFGGMLIALLSMFVVPVLFCMVKEQQYRNKN